ncbi:MAG: hypothetical protein CL672_02495 [Balneola sp.]|nr:hypothetical protein [Balneola sp.]
MSFIINSKALKDTTTKHISPKVKQIKRFNHIKLISNTTIFPKQFGSTQQNVIIQIYITISFEDI